MKKDPQSRRWILTLPFADYPQETVEEALRPYAYVGQLEAGGKTAYKHWQVYIQNKGAIRFSTLKRRFPKGHFEIARGTPAECVAYVSKPETALGVRIENGEIDVEDNLRGQLSTLSKAREMIVEEGKSRFDVYQELGTGFTNARALREMEALALYKKRQELVEQGGQEREVIVLCGPPGSGKTRWVYENFAGELYSVGGYQHPFDEYAGERVLVLDEFNGQLEFELLLKLLDRYPVHLPARYQNKFALYDTVVIISNLRLDQMYRDVQAYAPLQWDALMRRVSRYQWLDFDGVIRELPLPCAQRNVA